MSGRLDSIQRLFQTLNKHSEVVSDAFAGPVSGAGDRTRESAIDALTHIGAIKAYEEGTYYLSAPLYEYCSSALQSFHALQVLTRISSAIHQATWQWDELRTLRLTGASHEVARIERDLERSIFEIGYAVDRNITLLTNLVSGQYGNVQDLQAKMRQNTFYLREIESSLDELTQVDAFVQRVQDTAVGEALNRLRGIVVRRLRARMLPWSARLKDVQAEISRRLFEARLMDKRLRQLARYSSWLTSNASENGWDLEIPESVDPALVRPEPITLRSQPDFSEPVAYNMTRLIEAANRLPAEREARPVRVEEGDNRVISDEIDTFTVPLEPHEVALERLRVELEERARGGRHGPVSLAQWRQDVGAEIVGLGEIELEHWLFYAATQLRGEEYRLTLVPSGEVEAFPVNTRFCDIDVIRLRKGSWADAALAA